MFGSCPVVRIKYDNPDGFCEINESDFDPKTHTLFEADEAEPQDAEAATKRKYTRKPRADAPTE